MKDYSEIEEAAERAVDMQRACGAAGRSQYSGMTYEDGLRDALDWVCENSDEDPTDPTQQ